MKQAQEARKLIYNVNALLSDLKSCTIKKDLQLGREIHEKVMQSQNDSNVYVVTAIVQMYAKCGSMVDARRVFDSIQKPDAVSWNVLILGYAENGEGLVSLDLFSQMKARGYAYDSVTCLAAIKACTSLALNGGKGMCLERGLAIHAEIGPHLNHYVKNTLMDMYSSCGSMVNARRIFNSIPAPNVVSWNVLILGYADNGEGSVALDLFSKMKARSCTPNSLTYVAAIKACTSLAQIGRKEDCLQQGRVIHFEVGSHLNYYVQSALIDMYANCGSMSEARTIFNCVRKPDVIAWNALILGYAENGEGLPSLELFSAMKTCGVSPDTITYVAAIKACSLTGDLVLGRKIHSEIAKYTGHVLTCLVDFYAKCGSMVEAREVFDLHPKERETATWNALLAGYGGSDSGSVFKLFQAMQDEGFRPDGITFVCVLVCCIHAGFVEKAREYLDAMSVQYGVVPTVMHYTCMVDVFGRANQLNEAVGILRKMPHRPDAVTWRTLLDACRKWKNVEIARLAYESLVVIDKTDESAYILMAHIYGSRGMLEEQKSVLKLGGARMKNYVHEVGNMVTFEQGPPG